MPLTVEMGSTATEIRDLVKYAGGFVRDGGFSDRLGFTELAVGRYRLEWEYTAGSSAVGVESEWIARGAQSFRVLPLDSFPDERDLVERLLQDCPVVPPGGDRGPIHRHVHAWLPEFYRSRYLSRVYLAQGLLLNERPFLEVYRGAVDAGAPSERTAALLALRMSMTDMRGEYTDEWRDSLRELVRSQLEREVLLKRPRGAR
jgi:hypothetical protein